VSARGNVELIKSGEGWLCQQRPTRPWGGLLQNGVDRMAQVGIGPGARIRNIRRANDGEIDAEPQAYMQEASPIDRFDWVRVQFSNMFS
jgi:hypothetical protein